SVSYSVPASGTYEFEPRWRQFGHAYGDYDGDGEPTPADYHAIIAASGHSISSSNYNPAVDLDLNGTVDAVDTNRANSILNTVAVGEGFVCEVDIDDSGTVDSLDMIEFLALFDAADPQADWDGNGLFDSFDVIEYLADFDFGCPWL
ncbi:MAG: GC-type dockerin domain-anchored protein, partial [Planctomycetota bacterium]